MIARTTACLATLLTLVVPPALANFGNDPPKQPSPSSTSAPDASGRTLTARQEAEKWYGDAYRDVDKAKQEVTAGKGKNAEKRFRRALERGERAAGLDSTYHEAWNLVGYCARQLKLYPQSLAAYQRCLAIKSDYVPAREYLGELYVDMGDLDKAMEQLAWLEKLEAEFEVKDLKARIDAMRVANGSTTETAAADTAKSEQK